MLRSEIFKSIFISILTISGMAAHAQFDRGPGGLPPVTGANGSIPPHPGERCFPDEFMIRSQPLIFATRDDSSSYNAERILFRVPGTKGFINCGPVLDIPQLFTIERVSDGYQLKSYVQAYETPSLTHSITRPILQLEKYVYAVNDEHLVKSKRTTNMLAEAVKLRGILTYKVDADGEVIVSEINFAHSPKGEIILLDEMGRAIEIERKIRLRDENHKEFSSEIVYQVDLQGNRIAVLKQTITYEEDRIP